MPRATCRCGQPLSVPTDGSDRVVCPKCGARVRIRLKRDEASPDGFLRFFCPCGRRLKVSAVDPPLHGKCPDCGRIVPVPEKTAMAGRPPGGPQSDTVDLGPDELAVLERWASGHGVRASGPTDQDDRDTPPVLMVPKASDAPNRAEAGMRICPNCHKPVHLGSEACRVCGTPVPRR